MICFHRVFVCLFVLCCFVVCWFFFGWLVGLVFCGFFFFCTERISINVIIFNTSHRLIVDISGTLMFPKLFILLINP